MRKYTKINGWMNLTGGFGALGFASAFLGLTAACTMPLDGSQSGEGSQASSTAAQKIQLDDSELGSEQFLDRDLPMVEVEVDARGPLNIGTRKTAKVKISVSNTEYFSVGNARLLMPDGSVFDEELFEEKCGSGNELLVDESGQSVSECEFSVRYNELRGKSKHGKTPGVKMQELFTIEYEALPRFEDEGTELETYELPFSVSFMTPSDSDGEKMMEDSVEEDVKKLAAIKANKPKVKRPSGGKEVNSAKDTEDSQIAGDGVTDPGKGGKVVNKQTRSSKAVPGKRRPPTRQEMSAKSKA